jgi:S1-C subfamily serine protease
LKENLKLDKAAKGLYVVQITADSPSDIIGLRAGDRLTSVNGEDIRDLASFYRLLREKTDKELWFGFIRSDTPLETLKFKR